MNELSRAATSNSGTPSTRPDWLRNFEAWVGGLDLVSLADIFDVLARELDTRNISDYETLAMIAGVVRGHEQTGVQQAVGAFLARRRANPPDG